MKMLTGLVVATIAVSTAPAWAASASGEWLVADRSARVTIDACGGKFSGHVSWEREHGLDVHNPDPRRRTRPTLGMAIFSGMKASAPETWAGRIYNAENGQTYSATVRLLSADALQVQGCVMGLLCGSETWTRVGRAVDCAASSTASRRSEAGATEGRGQ